VSAAKRQAFNDEEIAFYDALAQNKSARDVMGEAALRIIAHELVTSLKGSVTVDWMHRDAARARMRVLVKRILRKYGYPPDLQDAAVQTVLQQAGLPRTGPGGVSPSCGRLALPLWLPTGPTGNLRPTTPFSRHRLSRRQLALRRPHQRPRQTRKTPSSHPANQGYLPLSLAS
jgi:hypothetical protein